MTLKIERYSDARSTTIRLIGRMQQEHLEEVKSQMKDGGPRVALDLEQVNLVDIDVVRFLAASKVSGVELLHCPQYIEEWITKEWDRKG
jgi:hypothetical protein